MPAKLVTLRAVAPSALAEVSEREARRRFRYLRMARFRSQLAAAIFLGVGIRSVERWESGAVRIPAWALVALDQREAA